MKWQRLTFLLITSALLLSAANAKAVEVEVGDVYVNTNRGNRVIFETNTNRSNNIPIGQRSLVNGKFLGDYRRYFSPYSSSCRTSSYSRQQSTQTSGSSYRRTTQSSTVVHQCK